MTRKRFSEEAALDLLRQIATVLNVTGLKSLLETPIKSD